MGPIRKNSRGAWKKAHADFLNAQFEKSEAFYKRLVRTPGGKKKIIRLFGIKNLDAVPLLKAKEASTRRVAKGGSAGKS